jgi:phosphoserine phosphatase
MTNTTDQLLITVSGPDKPGITSALMKILADSPHELIDIGQAVTHGLLSLSFVIEFKNAEDKNNHVLKDLLFEVNRMGLNLNYQVVKERLSHNLEEQKQKFIVSCVSHEGLSSAFLGDVAESLASFKINIQRIDKLSPGSFECIEIMTSVPDEIDWNKLKKEIIDIGGKHQTDVAFLKDNVFRRSKRLIVFDMDSTLIQAEVIDEMAKACGKGEKVSAVTERAMNGEIDFDESLRERVACLKGLEVKTMQKIFEELPLTQGVEDFLMTIKGLGLKVAVISGGFTFFTDAIKNKLGLDYAFGNQLEIENGVLTGRVSGTIVNANQKAFLLKFIAQQEGIHPEQVVAIGDGANDLPMLASAGLGIAFHAKDVVKQAAHSQLSHGPMTSILYFLGIPGPGEHHI